MPEWITTAEGFRMILRATKPDSPGLADQITSAVWFFHPKMHMENQKRGRGHSPADIAAARTAFDLFVSEYQVGRIPSRGILNGTGPIDIDPLDAMTGSLSVFEWKLDCAFGRMFRNVVVDKASVRRVIAAAVAPVSAPIVSTTYIRDFVHDYINNNPSTHSQSGVRGAWKTAGHGTHRRREVDDEYKAQAILKDGFLRKRGQRTQIAKS
jgi:hypothetical protein